MSIFVCYRRSDSKDLTGRIHDWVEQKLPNEKVIRDVDDLHPGGVPYRGQLQAAVSACEVFILVIGSSWLSVRLTEANDVLREEIERALELQIAIIPVLIDDAKVPREEQLPESIRGILRYQTVRVRSDRGFKQDVLYLIERVELTLADERRRKAAIPDEIGASTHSPRAGIRIGAIYALAEMLPGDQTGAIRARLREMLSDPDSTVANYARQSLGENEREPEDVETALDEADFFATRGLYEDARAILNEQLARTPHHPLVAERLREVNSV
ncbi:MAG TPA: toll/interleukin-1 receptor domain-containing protein, partial [Polyangiaceae bacterium]